MSIQARATLTDANAGLSSTGALTREPFEASSAFGSIEVTTVDETVALGDVKTPRYIIVKHISGDPLRIGLDGSTYPFRLTSAQEPILLTLDVAGLVETQTITTVADVASSLDGTYLTLEGKSGTWAIWIDVGNNGTAEPAHGKTSSVEVTGVVADNTAAQVTTALRAALNASTAFLADFVVAATSATVTTITDRHTGSRTNLTDTGTTGFTVATTQAGAASPVIHMKSTGTTQAVVGVIPN